jgi:hypothetical protein
MKNELEHILKKHFSKKPIKIFYNELDKISEKSISFISQFISILEQYDHPDIYGKIGNDVLFIEHFEFDSSQRSKKGSKEVRERIRIDNKEKEILNYSRSSKSFSDKINSNASLENLIKNVTEIFSDHINKIPVYIKHLHNDNILDDTTNLMKCFFIESSSPFNSYVNTDKGYTLLNLFYTDFFIDMLEQNKHQIDYIFHSFEEEGEAVLYFMDIKGLSVYKKKTIRLTKDNFFPMEPSIIRAQVFIKDEVRTEITDIPKDE